MAHYQVRIPPPPPLSSARFGPGAFGSSPRRVRVVSASCPQAPSTRCARGERRRRGRGWTRAARTRWRPPSSRSTAPRRVPLQMPTPVPLSPEFATRVSPVHGPHKNTAPDPRRTSTDSREGRETATAVRSQRWVPGRRMRGQPLVRARVSELIRTIGSRFTGCSCAPLSC